MPTEEQIINKFQQMRQELANMTTKMTELDIDVGEHSSVIRTLEKLPETRKCFRLVGGVLVESDVKTVKPSLIQNKEAITAMITTLQQQYLEKEKLLAEFQQQFNIRIKSQEEIAQQARQESGKKPPAGVLV
eukprot:TRINITY_DN4141_c0_g1_i1.p1 TRINITY_DN4141_c0_g1~~TRINITY_DN4141_c0_g1_i1.p1  ORF type:complete len:132 (+),score=41.58 TRINITY_DN4141_c0_g1_i1:53-448(+)